MRTNSDSAFADLVDGLNPEQRQAVCHGEGPVLVSAGAGSGKTRVITYRIAYLIRTGLARPWEILGLTFTNKAADTMQARVESIIGGGGGDKVMVRTFHSFCAWILRREAERLGYRQNFSIYDDKEQKSVVKQCIEKAGLKADSANVDAVHNAVSVAKNFCAPPSEFISPSHPLLDRVDELAALYEKSLLDNNAMDFDNLILKAIELLSGHADVLEKMRRHFRFILVDEYQDTNAAQFQFLIRLAGRGGNLMVVGDVDQSIYGWRGADTANILEFEGRFTGVKKIELGRNYRSTQGILNVANALIHHNRGSERKRLWSDLGDGEKSTVCQTFNERDEADFVAEEVQRLLLEGFRLDDFAILIRTRAQTRVFEETFLRLSIPFKVVGLAGFYERMEVKDMICYLRLIVNPADREAFARVCNVPRRGIGPKAIEETFAVLDAAGCDSAEILDSEHRDALPKKVVMFVRMMAELRKSADGASVSDVIDKVLSKTGYKEFLENMKEGEGVARLENIHELKSTAVEHTGVNGDESLYGFISRLSLHSDTDAADWEAGAVKLLTLHSAKGLEFRVVFLAGMEEGLLPHRNALLKSGEVDEERRLCYVGITRARERLYLLSTVSRMLYGSVRANLRSRFIDEIPLELVQDFDPDNSDYFVPPENGGFAASASHDWRAGDRVRHSQLGEGMIVSLKGDEICVAFDGLGIKRLHTEFAKLHRV